LQHKVLCQQNELVLIHVCHAVLAPWHAAATDSLHVSSSWSSEAHAVTMSPLEAKELFLPVEVAGSDVEACGDGLDLAVKVVESASKQQKEAYDYAGSILNHPQLSHEEKHSLLWVLAQSPAFHSLVPSSIIDDEVHDLPEWIHCSSSR
jgi:hypothetical protein